MSMSCLCDERLVAITMRRWVLLSKMNLRGEAIVHCLACKATWHSKAEYVTVLKFDEGAAAR